MTEERLKEIYELWNVGNARSEAANNIFELIVAVRELQEELTAKDACAVIIADVLQGKKEENEQLRKLLKEVKAYIPSFHFNSEYNQRRLSERIDKALGEKE